MTATQPLLGGKAGSLQAAAGGGSGSAAASAPAPAPAAAAPGVGAYDNHRTLTLWPLVALIFFEVSGGPYGVEDAVGAGGPRYAILGFLIFPFIWSIPEALVCAELAGRFPENAGYVAWVSEAFGPFWGFVEGWCSWWSGAIDNGIYPGLLLAYIQQIFPDFLATKPLQLAALAALNVLLTCLNWRGLVVVGGAAMVLVVISVSPFLAMTALAVPHLQVIPTPSRVLGRISPIFPPFFPIFCAFSPSRRGGSNEPKTGIQGDETVARAPKHRFS